METDTQPNHPYEQASPLYEDGSMELLNRATNRKLWVSRAHNGDGYRSLDGTLLIGSNQIAPAKPRWRIPDPSIDLR